MTDEQKAAWLVRVRIEEACDFVRENPLPKKKPAPVPERITDLDR
jgi:hypothetical protein